MSDAETKIVRLALEQIRITERHLKELTASLDYSGEECVRLELAIEMLSAVALPTLHTITPEVSDE